MKRFYLHKKDTCQLIDSCEDIEEIIVILEDELIYYKKVKQQQRDKK